MGQSLTLLTAVLLVGQTPVMESNGKTCACKNGQQQGRVLAQPEMVTETRPAGWWNGRSSSTTTTETWNNGVQQTSWADNRPVLSKIRSWFGRGDNGTSTRTETVQPATSTPVIVQPAPATNEYNYRRLPTTTEPPLHTPPAKPAGQAKPAVPAPQKPAIINAPPAAPLTIDIEPIEFRSAGTAKGVTPAVAQSAAAPITTSAKPAAASRPNPINARFTNKVGQPGDYSWITGQLEIRNGVALIHYATPETVDQHNGSLPLSADAKLLHSVQNGDLVSVHGNVVQQSGRTVYRVRTIDLIER